MDKLNLQPEEKRVIELKYKSAVFGKMDISELKYSATSLMIKINFITGWALYEDKISQDILKEQLELKLVESYPNVNADEMVYAFRQNTGVKDWGKYMNLALIDEVMIPYLIHRQQVSVIEEAVIQPTPNQKIYTDEEILNQRREQIETAFQAMKKGYYPIIHGYFEEVLMQDEFLNDGENMNTFFVRKLGEQAEHIYCKS